MDLGGKEDYIYLAAGQVTKNASLSASALDMIVMIIIPVTCYLSCSLGGRWGTKDATWGNMDHRRAIPEVRIFENFKINNKKKTAKKQQNLYLFFLN